jgi:hypothetical protein
MARRYLPIQLRCLRRMREHFAKPPVSKIGVLSHGAGRGRFTESLRRII